MTNTIAIMGCGWLGLPLAKVLTQSEYRINGSTTSEEKIGILKEAGIHPFLISLSEDGIEGNIEGFLSHAHTLVINVPPKLRGDKKENYIKKMQVLHGAVQTSEVKKVIFVSSTSVYGDIEGEVTEATITRPATESGRQLLVSEDIFRNNTKLQVTIIRFGGLIGADRHPVTMLSKKKNLSNGNFPINLIHLDDCIKIISETIENEWWGETFNGVYPYHPTKREYYTLKAIGKRLQVPDYNTDSSKKGKIVSSYTLTNVKGFQFNTTL